MKITGDHYLWWMQKQKAPSLFKGFTPNRVSIHTLINSQNKQPRENCTVLNTYSIIRSRLHRGCLLVDVLDSLYMNPGCNEPKKRRIVVS